MTVSNCEVTIRQTEYHNLYNEVISFQILAGADTKGRGTYCDMTSHTLHKSRSRPLSLSFSFYFSLSILYYFL